MSVSGQTPPRGSISLIFTAIDRDHYLPSAGGVAPEKASAILAQFSRKKFAAQIAVPTDDKKVRARLRELGEPITLFGEAPAERRDRLRELLTQQAEDGVQDEEMGGMDEKGDEEPDEEYYTEGTQELLEARKDIARYSLARVKKRIAFQKAESTIPLRTHVKHRKTLKERLAGFDLFGSQIASERPLGAVRFAPDGNSVAVGTWAGTVKLVSIPNLEESMMLRGHTEIVSGISWFPTSASSPSGIKLATGGGEGHINLWNLEADTPTTTLSGHSGRVAAVEFHPLGRYLASASYDGTWRLWDVESTTELLVQDGHAREVHALSINGDGSLIASAGLDSIGRIWDLRTGRIVMYLDSHMGPIYALDWSPDSYRILSGSADGFLKCWDVRNVNESASIGAHTGGVTDVRWFKGTDGPASRELPEKEDNDDWIPKKSGTFIVSAGFDRNVKILSADDWSLCKTLSGHGGNVTGVDVTADAKWIVSSGRDRTVKLWGRDDGQGI
jgi:U4/U6 small nuclear ribonucleoprotein PRP4